MPNILYFIFPRLFGCRRSVLPGLAGDAGLQKLLDGLQKLGAIKIGEAGVGYFDNYHFKLNGRRVGVIFEEYRSLKLIAPPEIIKSIENELGIRAVYLSIRQFSN